MRRHYADWIDRKSCKTRYGHVRELNRGSHVDGGYALMGVESRVRAFPSGSSSARAVFALALAGVALGGCAQPPRTAGYHGKEYFSVAKYGAASPRVVEDGQPVPRGGGQYLVGHPYTIAGHKYYPGENSSYTAVGMASWYGDAFHGRRTANGEVYDMRSLTAAHPTMPLPSYARVTNLSNGYSVIVRVNDRGPYHGGRVMDVSSRVADVLDFKANGHGQDQGRVCRASAARRFRRQRIARQPAHRRIASDLNGMAPATETEVAAAEPATPSFFHFGSSAPRPAPAPAPCRARGSAGVAARPGAGQRRRGRGSPSAPHRASSGAPARPFDLGRIPYAAPSVMAAARPPLPPVRLSSNDRALYFAPSPGGERSVRATAGARRATRAVAQNDDELQTPKPGVALS